MTQDDIKALIEVRTMLIKEYKNIPGKDEPSSLIRARDVAITYDRAIRKIDKILTDKVNFRE
jgi:hypothetical protein